MTDDLNVNAKLYKLSTGYEFGGDSPGDEMPFDEEITVTKTEIKEEIYDSEMPVGDIEFVNVKKGYICSDESSLEENNLEVIDSEGLLNENVVSGNSQLREGDLQQKQKLSTKRLHLKHYKPERRNYLKRRIEKQYGQTKKYKCTICKYAAHRKHDLERHIRTHVNDRPFKCTYKNCDCTAGQEGSCKCDMCGYAAIKEHNLKLHILTKHSAEPKKFKCADCNYATHRKFNLEQHTHVHTNDRPFKCTYKNCECAVGQDEPCKCGMCGYAAVQKSTLKKHILRKHTTEPKKYKCADCNYATQIKANLEQHIRGHTNDRPFKCTYKNCDCTVGQEESCKCSMCGYAAAQEDGLKVHILTKHSTAQKVQPRAAHPCTYQ